MPDIDIEELTTWLDGLQPGHTLSWRKEVQRKLRARAHIYAARVVADDKVKREVREALEEMGHTAIHVGLCGTLGPLIEPKDCPGCTALAKLKEATK